MRKSKQFIALMATASMIIQSVPVMASTPVNNSGVSCVDSDITKATIQQDITTGVKLLGDIAAGTEYVFKYIPETDGYYNHQLCADGDYSFSFTMNDSEGNSIDYSSVELKAGNEYTITMKVESDVEDAIYVSTLSEDINYGDDYIDVWESIMPDSVTGLCGQSTQLLFDAESDLTKVTYNWQRGVINETTGTVEWSDIGEDKCELEVAYKEAGTTEYYRCIAYNEYATCAVSNIVRVDSIGAVQLQDGDNTVSITPESNYFVYIPNQNSYTSITTNAYDYYLDVRDEDGNPIYTKEYNKYYFEAGKSYLIELFNYDDEDTVNVTVSSIAEEDYLVVDCKQNSVSLLKNMSKYLFVDVAGKGLKYQWQKCDSEDLSNWINIGELQEVVVNELRLEVVAETEGVVWYRCVVTNEFGKSLACDPIVVQTTEPIDVVLGSNSFSAYNQGDNYYKFVPTEDMYIETSVNGYYGSVYDEYFNELEFSDIGYSVKKDKVYYLKHYISDDYDSIVVEVKKINFAHSDYMMYLYNRDKNIDIRGWFEDNAIQTTFSNTGYETVIREITDSQSLENNGQDSSNGQENNSDEISSETVSAVEQINENVSYASEDTQEPVAQEPVVSEPVTDQPSQDGSDSDDSSSENEIILQETEKILFEGNGITADTQSGLQVTPNVDFSEDGKFAVVSYTVSNPTDKVKKFSLGVNSDIQIDDDDYASVYLTNTGLSLVSSEGTAYYVICNNVEGITDVDTMWFGHFGERYNNQWNDYDRIKLDDTDSGFSMAWQNREIQPGKSMIFTFELGVGESGSIVAPEDTLIADGECGENMRWTLNNNGTLTVRGKGDMNNYEIGQAPWLQYNDFIKKIVIGYGITHVGDYAFYNLNKLTGAKVPATVISLGEKSLGYTDEGKVTGFTIDAYKNSAAEKYAIDNEFLVGELGDENGENHVHDYYEDERKEATCTEDGFIKSICSGCGDEKSEVIEKLNHTYVAQVTQPTCTQEGYTTHKCIRCSDSYIDSKVNPLGHTEELELRDVSRFYTGDEYCKRCNEMVHKGTAIQVDISSFSAALEYDSVVYNGKDRQPKASVEASFGDLVKDEDFEVIYSNNKNVGTATVTINGIGNYKGTITKKFNITKADNSINVKTAVTKTASASKSQTFSLGAKATSGAITYKSSNTSIKVSSSGVVTIPKNFSGKFTVTLTAGNANYKSVTKNVAVTVNKAANNLSVSKSAYTKVASATGVQHISLGAKATSGASSIKYTSNNKSVTVKAGKVTIPKNFVGKAVITVTAGNQAFNTVKKTVTITVNPAVPKIIGVANTAKKTANVKWSKLAYVSGYTIQYSLNSNFKNAKTINVTKASTISKVITKLSVNKTYYIRIKAYKTVGNVKYQSAWSAKKSVKIKK